MGLFDGLNNYAQSASESKFYSCLSDYEYSYKDEAEADYKDGDKDDTEREAALVAYIRLCDKEPVELEIDYEEEWRLMDNTKTYVPLKNIFFSKRKIEKVYNDRIEAWYEEYTKSGKSEENPKDILKTLCQSLSNSLEYRNIFSDTFDVNIYEMAALKHILINEYGYNRSSFPDIVLDYAFDSDYCPVTSKYKLG